MPALINTVLANIPPGAVIARPVTILFLFLGKTFNNSLSSSNSSSWLANLLFDTLILLNSPLSLIFSSLNEPADLTSSSTPAISLTGLLKA